MTPFIIIIPIRKCKNMDFEKNNTQKEYSYSRSDLIVVSYLQPAKTVKSFSRFAK